MKKLLLKTVLLFFCIISFGQNEELSEYSKQVDGIIENLDASQITSGILLDRSINWSGLDELNTNNEIKTINYKYFKQALLDLHIASNKKMFISSTTLKDNLKKSRIAQDVINIGIISTSYESLNYNESDATKSGLKLENNKFQAISGKSAFLNNSSLIISPLRIAAKGKTITYKFRDDFWFDNSKEEIISLTADFGENKVVEIIKNNKIILNEVKQVYSITGDKKISFVATYANGTQKSIKSQVYIIVENDSAQKSINSTVGKVTNDYVIADESFNGAKGRMDYRIYFRTTERNPSLKKPIIIIDGFDPRDKRRITDADCANDPDCVSEYNGNFSNDEHVSIWEFNFYKNENGQTKNLIEELRAEGYDVVIVNNPTHQINGQPEIDGGADYIERNGLTLVTLIKRLNLELYNNHNTGGINISLAPNKLVIVGPSMGGQISRYALAYMEKKKHQTNISNWDHRTRLWISIDSPHLGANIPISLQAVVNQLAAYGIEGAVDFRDKQLGSVAAKQQLIEQFSGVNGNQLRQNKLNARTISQGYSYSRGSNYFITFYNNLFNNGLSGSKGYPQDSRNIAITNGSLKNSKFYGTDFLTQLEGDYFAYNGQRTLNIRGFSDILFTTHTFSLETYFKKNTGSNGKISRLKIGPSIGALDQSLYLTNNNSRGNMDNVSGGWFAGQYDLNKEVISNGLEFWGIPLGYLEERELEPTHSFISTFSALGHLNPDQSWHQALDANLVCNNNIPFDSYYGEQFNTRHTSFNAKNVAWIFEELDGNPQEPSFPVNPDSLVGVNEICQSETKTYNFEVCSTPGDVDTWTVSSNLQIMNSTTNSVSVKANDDNRWHGWIRATFENGVTVKKDIWVGKPSTPTNINGPDEVDTSTVTQYGGYGDEGSTSFKWELPIPYDTVTNFNIYANNWQVKSNPSRTPYFSTGAGEHSGLIKFSGVNRCGEGDSISMFVEHETSPNSDEDGIGYKISSNALKTVSDSNDEIIKVYPNPANNSININIYQEEVNEYIKVLLFDNLGRLITDSNFKGETLNIDTSKLSNGVYVLKVFSDKYRTTKKIVVQH